MVKPHRAVMILVFGILGLIVCQLFGIAAWVMGNNDLREMDNGLMDQSGRDLTSLGRILGMIGTALIVFPILVGVFVIVISIYSPLFNH